MNWEQFFKLMIIDEKAARAKYEMALSAASDPEIRKTLERLRDEEAFHVDFLEDNWQRLSSLAQKS